MINDIKTKIFVDENALSFYLLGTYITDGNIYSTSKVAKIRLFSKDKNWLESINSVIMDKNRIYTSKKLLHELTFNSRIICNWLMEYGCAPNKSKTMTLKKEIPKEYLGAFFLGLSDGDGSITTSNYKKVKNNKEYFYVKRTVYICSGSLEFINQLLGLIPEHIKCCISEHKRTNAIINNKIIKSSVTWRLVFNDSNAKKFLNWIYESKISCCLQRKKIKAQELVGANGVEPL